MLEFILERYNYWIVIILMMTGLYTVFARGNLVKKVVGLNVFQTSVFIFYITIGKVAGGTAPIYIGDELKHGDGHGGDGAHGTDDHSAGDHSVDTDHSATPHEAGDADFSKIDNQYADLATNDLKSALENLEPGEGTPPVEGLHAPPEGSDKLSNSILVDADDKVTLTIKPESSAGAEASDAAAHAVDAVAHHGEILYTNPLPHVLILTAIVVGVATTAVGLALAVRIREAYGSIEEDDLARLDNVAEFGAPGAEGGEAA